MIGGLSLLLLPLPFMLDPSQRWLGAAVAAYMLCIVLAASVGNYPVPVMGYGAAPIFGYRLRRHRIRERITTSREQPGR